MREKEVRRSGSFENIARQLWSEEEECPGSYSIKICTNCLFLQD